MLINQVFEENWLLEWGCRWSGGRVGGRLGVNFPTDNFSLESLIKMKLCTEVYSYRTQAKFEFGHNRTIFGRDTGLTFFQG